MDTISDRYRIIDDKVQTLSNARTFERGKTRLIVVTKGQPLDSCLEVIEAGAKDLGENYPVETHAKFSNTNLENVSLHMIGHLQSRKIKLLFPIFNFIHSLDSLEHARKVSEFCVQQEKSIKGLLEINLTEETTKSGFDVTNKEKISEFIEGFGTLKYLPGLDIIGLMTMGFYPEDKEINRPLYISTRMILEEIQNRYKVASFSELSMGTSGDYETAIEEGASFVRIGELIMGPRLLK